MALSTIYADFEKEEPAIAVTLTLFTNLVSSTLSIDLCICHYSIHMCILCIASWLDASRLSVSSIPSHSPSGSRGPVKTVDFPRCATFAKYPTSHCVVAFSTLSVYNTTVHLILS